MRLLVAARFTKPHVLATVQKGGKVRFNEVLQYFVQATLRSSLRQDYQLPEPIVKGASHAVS